MKTAIDCLRSKYTRPGLGIEATTTTETAAILELAERLDKVEAGSFDAVLQNWLRVTGIKPAATEISPEPFRITGLGRYRTRDGRIAVVTGDDGSSEGNWPWEGMLSGREDCWNTDGSVWDVENQHPDDIVAGPLVEEPAQDTAGLTGWISRVVYNGNEIVYLHASEQAARSCAGPKGEVYALDQLPASALVKPEPKRETRKVWLNVHEKHSVGSHYYYSKQAADEAASPGREACLPLEITFTHGEGLTP